MNGIVLIRPALSLAMMIAFSTGVLAAELRFQVGETGFDVPGDAMTCAGAGFRHGEPVVEFRLGDRAAKLLAKLTADNVGKELVMSSDRRELQRAMIVEPITGGNVVISGRFSIEETKALVKRLGARDCGGN